MNYRTLLLLLVSLLLNLPTTTMAQAERVRTLPNVEVDTLAFPALRILQQLQQHEGEDRFATLESFDVHTEGDYFFEFRGSKFLRKYARGMLSVLGFPRMGKIFLGRNELVTHRIHAWQHYGKGRLKEVDIRLDSANIDLTPKQYDLIKRSNLTLDEFILTQLRSPKNPWGSKRYNRYEWLLLDTLTLNGHRVDVLQYTTRPRKGLRASLEGKVMGKVWIIEDYWRIIGAEQQNLKNRSATSIHMEEVAPGVFLPRDLTTVEDLTLDYKTIFESKNLHPDSLTEKQRQKLDKKLQKAAFSICDGYRLRMEYDGVKVKE